MENDIEDLKKQIEELKSKLSHTQKNSSTKPVPVEQLNEEETEIYSWKAPVRVFNKLEKRTIITIILWVGILSVLLIVLHEIILFITVIILTAVSLLLFIIPPAITTHSVTNKGIRSFGKLFLWEDLADFWMARKKTTIVLYIDTLSGLPASLFFVVPAEHAQEIANSLSQHVKYFERRTKQNLLGKLSDGDYVPFNDIKNLKNLSIKE